MALHEAGHATVALVLGLDVKEASILPDPVTGSAGHVLLAERCDERVAVTGADRAAVEREILLQLAGPRAEELGGMRPSREEWQRHQDIAERLALLVHPPLSDSELWAFVAWLDVRARSLLTQHWPGVLALRDALLAASTLQGVAHIAAVVESALAPSLAAHRTSRPQPLQSESASATSIP